MPEIKVIDKVVFNGIAKDIMDLIAIYGEEHGIVFENGGGSFFSKNFKLKIKGSVKDKNGNVLSEEIEYFKKYCYLFDLKVSDLGKSFRCSDNDYVIIGMKRPRRNTKYPILAKDTRTGKIYKFAADDVHLYFEQGIKRLHLVHGTSEKK